MPTVRQIAQRLKVSPATVSRALNSRPGIGDDTRRRVLQAVNELGYGRNVGVRASRYVGFIHPLGSFQGNIGFYHGALLGGIATTLSREQLDLALIDPYRDKQHDESFSQFFQRKDLRGVLIQVRPHNQHVVDAIDREGFPMLTIASKPTAADANWIVIDSAAQFANAVRYLADLGHRRIGIAMREADDYDHAQRFKGYHSACVDLGLPLDPLLAWRIAGDAASGASVIRHLHSLADPPTAILFTNAESTIGALHACMQMNIKLPDDLSIVGFDDTTRRYDVYPAYTSVCQNAQNLGEEAARWIGRIIAGQTDGPVQVTLPAIFEVHHTTGPAKSR